MKKVSNVDKEQKHSRKWLWKAMRGVFVIAIVVVVSILMLRDASDKQLSKKQKLEDFDYLYDTLIEHQPMLDAYKEVIGFDFEGNRDYYRQLIADTKDDYEFCVMMYMIIGDFPSCHTSIGSIELNTIRTSGCEISQEIQDSIGEEDYAQYWNEYYLQYCREETDRTVFCYEGGRYIAGGCDISKEPQQALTLLAINGESIDEYILRKEVNGMLLYDAENQKVYRKAIELNLFYGQLVKATFQNLDGEIFEREVYIRNKDYAFEGERIDPIEIPPVEKLVIDEPDVEIEYIEGKRYSVALDHTNDLAYIGIYGLRDIDGGEVSKAIGQACEKEHIILDFRINLGGHREKFMQYVYSVLYQDGLSIDLKYQVRKDTVLNKIFYVTWEKNKYMKIAEEEQIEDDFSMEVALYGKGNGVEDKKVYMLISNNTGSAADFAAMVLKEHTDAVLIGGATGGEGLAGAACIDILPNSKATFKFQCSQAFNADGTDNSVYGTTPDIYVAQTLESIAKQEQLIEEGITYSKYEERLKWDNVLLETIEMIKEQK